MLMTFLNWFFSLKFTQNASATVVGTAIATAPLFGILDRKLSGEIQRLDGSINERATIVYVDHKNSIVGVNHQALLEKITSLEKRIDRQSEKQDKQTDHIIDLLKKGR